MGFPRPIAQRPHNRRQRSAPGRAARLSLTGTNNWKKNWNKQL
jgi:hypothetical protein